MKNSAVQLLLANQHLVPVSDVTVESIACVEDTYEFKATVLNNSQSIANGFPIREELKVTIKSEPWKNEF